jgi:hypothetical protein
MQFGPGAAVLRSGLDESIISPWISLSSLSGGSPIVTFREFPGNLFAKSRIARSVSVRGRYNGGACITRWSDEVSSARNGPWESLDGFQWTTRVASLSAATNPTWEQVQLRIRVADLGMLFGDVPPPSSIDPGPGPYLDRVRVGFLFPGPFIDIGPDTRFQAQDAFPTQPTEGHYTPSNNIFGTCAFSMATDIRSGFGDRVVVGDSIVARVGSYGGNITKVAFIYRIVRGPHIGKKVLVNAEELSGG